MVLCLNSCLILRINCGLENTSKISKTRFFTYTTPQPSPGAPGGPLAAEVQRPARGGGVLVAVLWGEGGGGTVGGVLGVS